MRPLPAPSQPSTQSLTYIFESGPISTSVAKIDQRNFSSLSNSKPAPLGFTRMACTPLEPALPRKSTRKNDPRYFSGSPTPGSYTNPEGPSATLATGGTMYAACPANGGYQIFSRLNGPRSAKYW